MHAVTSPCAGSNQKKGRQIMGGPIKGLFDEKPTRAFAGEAYHDAVKHRQTEEKKLAAKRRTHHFAPTSYATAAISMWPLLCFLCSVPSAPFSRAPTPVPRCPSQTTPSPCRECPGVSGIECAGVADYRLCVESGTRRLAARSRRWTRAQSRQSRGNLSPGTS